MIAGSLMNDQTLKALAAVTIIAKNLSDSNFKIKSFTTDKDGNFLFTNLALGHYRHPQFLSAIPAPRWKFYWHRFYTAARHPDKK